MIYLLRHGMDNEEYVGGYSNIELTDKGIKQIENISLEIQKLNIKKIYTSDILRAVQTAQIVNSYLNKEVIIDSNLRELNKGKLNGKLKSKLTKSEIDNLSTMDIRKVIGGGESMLDLYKRVRKLLLSGYFSDKDESLLVTHRGFINMLYFFMNDLEVMVEKEKFGVVHASLHELDIAKKKIRRII